MKCETAWVFITLACLLGWPHVWHLCDVKTTDHMKAQLQLGEKSTDSQAFKTQREKNPHHWSINSCLEAQLQRSNPL
jgi:type IV secretory pathway VirD2 relaxase